MQHIMEMWREAKTVDTRAKRLPSWVHLDYWTKALVRRIQRVIIQNAEMETFKLSILTGKQGKEQLKRLLTYHPFSPSRRPGPGPSRSQTPTPCCQRGCLPASTSGPVCRAVNGCMKHKPTHHTLLPSCSRLLHIDSFIYRTTHQILPGSLPWYIMARMRQDGFRTITLFSYLGKDQMRTSSDDTNFYLSEMKGFLQKSLTSSFSSWCICPGHIPSYLWM